MADIRKKVNKFEDVIAWQKSQILAINIYKLFKNCKDYSFRDQICRASISISNNIAEGFEKNTNNDFIKFLFIAKASCGEVRSMAYLARDLKYISTKNFQLIHEQSIEISKLIYGFIKSLKNNNFKTF